MDESSMVFRSVKCDLLAVRGKMRCVIVTLGHARMARILASTLVVG